MRKTILAAVASGFLFMGATCSSTDITTLVEQVQAATAQACKFVPTINTIIALIGLKDPNISSAQQIADTVCRSVGQMGAEAPGSGKVRGGAVSGVQIDGYRVR